MLLASSHGGIVHNSLNNASEACYGAYPRMRTWLASTCMAGSWIPAFVGKHSSEAPVVLERNARGKHPSYWTNMLGGNDGRKREGRHCRQVVLLSQSFPGWICVGIRSNLPLTRIGDSAISQLGCGNRWHARCSGATRIFHRPAARSGVLVSDRQGVTDRSRRN